jgi:hypothetical protein
LGRRFLGTDLNPEAVALTASRLRQFGEGREPSSTAAASGPDLLTLMGPR